MGMGSAPCSAYILPADETTLEMLGCDTKEIIQIAKNYMKENDLPTSQWGKVYDFDDALCILADCNVPLKLTLVPIVGKAREIEVEVYRYDAENGDRYDELEDGYYIIFDENDLYERKLTTVGKMLKSTKLLPEYKQWTNFG